MRRVLIACLCLQSLAAAGEIQRRTDAETGWEVYRLSQDQTVVEIVPAAGFNAGSIVYQGTEILRRPDDLRRLRGVAYGVPILYPSPNRVAGASFEFAGQRYSFPANNGTNFIHGLVHSVPWKVVAEQHDQQSATLVGRVDFGTAEEPLGHFPIPHALEVSITVTPSAVRWTYQVDNRQGSQSVPFGFGLHPYFIYLGEREATWVTIPATHLMESRELLPTGKLLSLDDHPLDARTARPLSQLDADDVYFGMRPEQPARIEARDRGLRIELHASQDFTHLVLYTPDQPFFCLENQTCSTDAHNLMAGGHQEVAHLLICPPGASRGGWVEYRFQNK